MINQTFSFPSSSLELKYEGTGKSKFWGVKCEKCLEVKSTVEASANAHYNEAVVAGVAFSLAAAAIEEAEWEAGLPQPGETTN
jgi:hypothetical protein